MSSTVPMRMTLGTLSSSGGGIPPTFGLLPPIPPSLAVPAVSAMAPGETPMARMP